MRSASPTAASWHSVASRAYCQLAAVEAGFKTPLMSWLGALAPAMTARGEAAAAVGLIVAEGLEIAHRCGAVPLAERARTELAAAGARPRSVVRSGVEALTPSELRVARMAAEGRTNREIAQTLTVTPKTVETHLRHVFQKLGVERRTGPAGVLYHFTHKAGNTSGASNRAAWLLRLHSQKAPSSEWMSCWPTGACRPESAGG